MPKKVTGKTTDRIKNKVLDPLLEFTSKSFDRLNYKSKSKSTKSRKLTNKSNSMTNSNSTTTTTSSNAANTSTSSSSFQSYSPITKQWTSISTNSLPLIPISFQSQSSSSTQQAKSNSIKCLTYNTYSNNHSNYQSDSLLKLLSQQQQSGNGNGNEEQFDLISLQEVSFDFHSKLLSLDWVRNGYFVTGWDEYVDCANGNLSERSEYNNNQSDNIQSGSNQSNSSSGAGNNWKGKPTTRTNKAEAVILLLKRELLGKGSKLELEFIRLKVGPTESGKALVVVKIYEGEGEGEGGREVIRVVSSHFTSLPQNSSLRMAQYNLALSQLLPNTNPSLKSILLGDFNNSTEIELDLFKPFLVDSLVVPSTSSFPATSSFPSTSSSNPSNSEYTLNSNPTFGLLYPFFPNTSHLKNPKIRKPKRVDRILSRGFESVFGYETIGGEPLFVSRGGGEGGGAGNGGERRVRLRDREGKDEGVYCSDHLGVVVRLGCEL